MKKFTKLSMVAAVLAAAFAFASCSNSSDSSGNNTSATTVAATETKGSVAAATTDASGNKTATLSASNGSYTFTESATASSSVAASAAVDATKGGKWSFTETGAASPKYKGSYKGDISKLASEEVKLSLSVHKVLSGGSLKEVSAEATFEFNATTSVFTATIPAVTVKADETPVAASASLAGKVFVGSDAADGKGVIAAFKSDGKVIFTMENKKFNEVAYTVSGNKVTFGENSATLSGTTLSGGGITATQISGSNGFGGKGFYSASPAKAFIVFETDSQVIVFWEGDSKFKRFPYTVSDGIATATQDGNTATFTVSGTTLSTKFKDPMTAELIQ